MSARTETRGRVALLAPPAAVAGAALIGAGLLAWVDVTKVSLLPCPLHAVTGLWCPLCGGTRAMDALVAGDVTAALGMNLLAVIAVPLVAIEWVRWMLGRARGRPTTFFDVSSRTITIVVVVMVGYTIVRNLPGMEMLTPG